MSSKTVLKELGDRFTVESCRERYSYNFTWLGRPIIQYPQDLVALQEIIWAEKPDVIIETGIAHGGSAIFFSSMLALLGGSRDVIAVDIDIRSHNRVALEAHPLYERITMIEGSSTASDVIDRVTTAVRGRKAVLVVLDSNHTHEHVLKELNLYSPFVSAGNHLIVFDTIIESLSPEAIGDRPWGKGNNPLTAVKEFLRDNDRFVVDEEREKKLLISTAPGGYLRCLKD